MSDLDRARAALRSIFGFEDFRPGQDEILSAVLDGEDVFAVMPTGSGKSLCYQLPAVLGDGLTIVVSPLIALMANQVAQLRANGISAAALNSSLTWDETRALRDDVAAGRLKLLYIAPERLMMAETQRLLAAAGVARLAVDEAHCISQWGHDFRKEYLALGDIQEALGAPQVIALTATADVATRSDIVARLFRREPRVFVHGFDRPNIRLAIRRKDGAGTQIAAFLEEHRGESGIVYCSTRARTEEMAATLAGRGFRAIAYHAGMDMETRARNLDTFLQEDGVVVVATIAFGMGIDKPDVRFVAHADMPKSVEAYYQEIGRAGRDGLPADTLTLYGLEDVKRYRQWIDQSEASDEQKRVEHQRIGALVSLCEAPRCRRQALLAYFGDRSEPCGNCDVCQDGIVGVDGTVAAQKALSAMYRTGQRFGREHLIAILTGDATDQVTARGHDRLPTFGVGQEFSKVQWRAIFAQLYAAGIADIDMTEHGRWFITEDGREVLKGRRTVELRRDAVEAPAKGSRKTARRQATASAGAELDADGQALLDLLKAERTRLARERNVPAYVIFPDRTLIDMAGKRPGTRAEMGAVHGIGAAKLAEFGDTFLAILRGFADRAA
ncbi:DNA helicase RecQ [Prosthecodimorpha staleyi]|uniref:DNA helicase RecQ n=1 Tax=Prosthecodimorpha staleyi TaxID=2840188 RepID=A0A947D9C3_9HYPH|nr:DNA helicase RecQ [Prosthecodimorpha staleyi]MBT9290467.1 DNA helicase RecQ [Prosthecodimorpha staleyi]